MSHDVKYLISTQRLPQMLLFFFCLVGNVSFVSGQSKKGDDKKKPSVEELEQLVENQMKALDLHNDAYKLYIRKEYRAALQLFNQALVLDTVNSHYFANRGHTHYALGNWKFAMADYRKANQVAPKGTHETYFQMAEILHKQWQQYKKALPNYQKAIELIHENGMVLDLPRCHFSRATCYLKLKQYENAIADFSKTIEMRPNHFGAYANRGMARYNTNDQDGACQDWRKAVELGYEAAQSYVTSYCK
ncbi:MAG: tetratricopeptide repeat protein [Flammeovirgaceae bacterium]